VSRRKLNLPKPAEPLPGRGQVYSPGKQGCLTRYTLYEARTQEALVEQLLAKCATHRDIARALTDQAKREFPHLVPYTNRGRVERVVSRIYARWRAEDKDPTVREKRRNRQVKNLEQGINRMEAEIAKPGTSAMELKTLRGEIRQHIEMLSRLTGTQEPLQVNLQVDVHTSQTLAQVMAGMDNETASLMLAEAIEDERFANAYRAQAVEPSP
jgi:hypothetical protein